MNTPEDQTVFAQTMVEICLLRRIEQLAYNVVEGEAKIAEARQFLYTKVPKRMVLMEVSCEECTLQLEQMHASLLTQLQTYAEKSAFFTADETLAGKQASMEAVFHQLQQEIPEFPAFLPRESLPDIFHQVLSYQNLKEKLHDAEQTQEKTIGVEMAVLNQPIPEAVANLRYDQFLLKDQIIQLLIHQKPEMREQPFGLEERTKAFYQQLVLQNIPEKYQLATLFSSTQSRGIA